MASTAHVTSPPTEPFPELESRPRTPASPSTLSKPPSIKAITAEKSNPLQADSTTKSPQLTSRLTPKLANRRLTPNTSPFALTGAAATAELRKRKYQNMGEDVRETSPNPTMQAVQALMGNGGISKPSDAPPTDKLSEPFQKIAEKITTSDHAQEDSTQASPVSLASFGTIESNGASAMTVTARDPSPSAPQFVAEPAQMADSPDFSTGNGNLLVAAADDAHKAFSYPGPPPQEQGQGGGPSRGMSLPGYGRGTPKSPASAKKHKCPYCATDFTRHHNLKSHLLTHSQEKPYECEKCQARFRRLHDLKRHFKLHTGEKPHICEKCKRSFARGDALARHNKGPGGCAGRRSSFGGDDEFGGDGTGDGMDGVEYTGEDEGSPDQGRRISEPSRKRTHLETPQDPNRQVYRQYSNTYPPPPGRPHSGSTSSMGPPQVILQGAGPQDSPREMSNQPSPSAASFSSAYYTNPNPVFQQPGAMTESPKPLSPGHAPEQHRLSVGDVSMSGVVNRNRSPSLTTQMQQAQFGRGTGGRTPPPHSHAPSVPNQHGSGQIPVLPPLSNQNQSQSRPVWAPPPAPAGPGPSMLQHQQLPPQNSNTGSNQGSMSSHGKSSGSSMREVIGSDPNDVWAYVRTLEQRVNRMENEYEVRIGRLHEKIISLETQVSNAGSYSSELAQTRYP